MRETNKRENRVTMLRGGVVVLSKRGSSADNEVGGEFGRRVGFRGLERERKRLKQRRGAEDKFVTEKRGKREREVEGGVWSVEEVGKGRVARDLIISKTKTVLYKTCR